VRLCAAQSRPVVGDLDKNVQKHVALIELAAARNAKLVFFSELSLTGYEPRMAKDFAISQNDARLSRFQELSDTSGIIIGAGIPTHARTGVRISMIIFQPRRTRLTYSKQLLHTDERAFFVSGKEQIVIESGGNTAAPAICYESLQPAHAENAARLGARLYLASVAKGDRQLSKAYVHYPAVASKHSMAVLMANCLGPCDDYVAVGQSAIWNSRGELSGQMDGETEGIIMLDTVSGEISVHGL
jgi:predicted amidohydrolase